MVGGNLIDVFVFFCDDFVFSISIFVFFSVFFSPKFSSIFFRDYENIASWWVPKVKVGAGGY